MIATDEIQLHAPPTFGQILKWGSAGFGISLLCFLPPILHFVSGPLGPFIGSIIVGTRVHITARHAPLVGLWMGALFGGLALIGVAVAEHISSGGISAYSPIPLTGVVWLIPLVPFAYVSLLGTSGGLVAAYLVRNDAKANAPTA